MIDIFFFFFIATSERFVQIFFSIFELEVSFHQSSREVENMIKLHIFFSNFIYKRFGCHDKYGLVLPIYRITISTQLCESVLSDSQHFKNT